MQKARCAVQIDECAVILQGLDLAIHHVADLELGEARSLLLFLLLLLDRAVRKNQALLLRIRRDHNHVDVLVLEILELLNIARGKLACRNECARVLKIRDAAALHHLDDLNVELLLALHKALKALPLAAVLVLNLLCGLKRLVDFLLEILHALFCHFVTSPESSQKAVICNEYSTLFIAPKGLIIFVLISS